MNYQGGRIKSSSNKGAYQSVLISIDEGGSISQTPTIINHEIVSSNAIPYQLTLEPGVHLLKVGEYLLGELSLNDNSMVFTEVSVYGLWRGITASQSVKRNSYVDDRGGTPDPSDPCPAYSRVQSQGRERLSDGSVFIWAIYYVYDCNRNLVNVVLFDMKIPPETAHLVACSANS